jgi:hypothetical protein
MDSASQYADLAASLRERLDVIANRELYERDPQAHLEQLKAASAHIDSAAAALPRPIPGDLAHFLKGSSYQKALAWLESRGHA